MIESRASRDMPDGHPMGLDFSAMPDGWQPEENKYDVDDGFVDDYSEDGSLPAAQPGSHGENPDNVPSRRDSQAPPPSFVPTVSNGPAVDEMAVLRRVLGRVCGVHEFVVVRKKPS